MEQDLSYAKIMDDHLRRMRFRGHDLPPIFFSSSLTSKRDAFWGGRPKALEYAEERLAEAQAMAAKNKAKGIKRVASGYNKFVAIVTEKAEEAREQGVSDNISEIVALATSKHLFVLDGVKDIVPEEAKGAIAQAKEVSMNGQKNALRALATENPERATEINLAALEGRLNRAKAKADENDMKEVEEAIEEAAKLFK